MKKGLHHVALTAADLQKTIDFYTRVFGFTVVRRWGDEKPARHAGHGRRQPAGNLLGRQFRD